MFDKTLAPYSTWTEGPFGVPMPDAMAKEVDAIVKGLPGGEEFAYKRAWAVCKASEMHESIRADISVIATPAVDRDREVILPSGVELAQFRKNPIVTFAHRYDMLPVGKSQWIKYEQGLDAIKAKTIYETKPDGWPGEWLPDAVWSMVKSGTLLGKSIGFVPIEFTSPTPEMIRKRPDLADARRVFQKVLMVEYAIAPIPSNPQALVEMVTKGEMSEAAIAALGIELPEIPEVDGEEVDPDAPIAVEMTPAELAAFRAWQAIEHKGQNGHYRIVGTCGHVIEQCRCMNPNKTETVADHACPDCQAKASQPQPLRPKHYRTLAAVQRSFTAEALLAGVDVRGAMDQGMRDAIDRYCGRV